jgi:ParB/RepB/Spo0J family partition protein
LDLELHQLDLPYEALRRRDPRRERQLRASMEEHGQASPAVVLPRDGRFVLVDGYKRLRALRSLRRDLIWAATWDLEEAEALLLEGLMRGARTDSALEQAWLLAELSNRFGMSQEELGRRFDRTAAWVSRRLALVRELPGWIQDHVRSGRLSPDVAMKVLVPLSRGKAPDALRFTETLIRARLSSREALAVYAGWAKGNGEIRARILADPALFLRCRSSQPGRPGSLRGDLELLREVARRGLARIEQGEPPAIPPGCLHQAQSACEALFTHLSKELDHAR